MRQIKKDDSYYIEELEKAFIRRKETEKTDGYYGEHFKNYQEMLDYHQAVDYDDMSRKIFNKRFPHTKI